MPALTVLSRANRARLRLAVFAIALVPVALLARILGSERLSEGVQRRLAQQWKSYDAQVRDAGAD